MPKAEQKPGIPFAGSHMNVRRAVLIPGEDCDQITFMTAYLHSITHPLGF
jgi:hypothetical protein